VPEKTPPNSRRNLDEAIARLFGRGEPFSRARKTIANTVVGQLLPKGAIKGGTSLKFRYGDSATRFTRDLDAVRAEDLEVFIQELDTALAEGWNGFTGRVVRLQPPKPMNVPAEYIMQPFDIKMAYNGTPWLTVQLEVGHDEVGDTDDPEYSISPEIVAIFEQLGFPAPEPVALMPIHHQIAQKLHGLSDEGSERAHDLVDLQLIAKRETIDYRLVKDTCQRLFDLRRKQTWPPVVVKSEGWESLYNEQADGLEVLSTVDEAVMWVNEFIATIDKAE